MATQQPHAVAKCSLRVLQYIVKQFIIWVFLVKANVLAWDFNNVFACRTENCMGHSTENEQYILGSCACEGAEQELEVAVPVSRSWHPTLGTYRSLEVISI